MANNNNFNNKDSIDISELASLNDDISPELIEQLQQKLSQDVMSLKEETHVNNFNVNDDTTLFEEPQNNDTQNSEAANKPEVPAVKKEFNLDKNFDDNFIKKYKAKLNKQADSNNTNTATENTISSAVFSDNTDDSIEKITQGNISERVFTPAQKNYNDSLDLLDGNIKYSKYVIYIAPENVDFIDSLTVKERKNLINKILREQDDIAITKRRFTVINAVIRHLIVAILTITISIPAIYWTINASLEATINNYRRSQSNFQNLYKENGKITNIR